MAALDDAEEGDALDDAEDEGGAKPKGGESVPKKTYHGPFMPKPSTPAQADPLDQVMTFRDFKEAVGLIYVTHDHAYLHDFQFERLARTRAEGGAK
jgi:hypothetical protein